MTDEVRCSSMLKGEPTEPAQALRVSVEGVTLCCSMLGEGPTVVLLHAGGEQRSVWRPVATQLARAGFRCVAVDQRGHGESVGAAAPPASLEQYAHDLQALLAVLAVPVVLVGASLGGLTSLLATTLPHVAEQVRGVVLVDVVPDPDPEGTRTYLRSVEARRAALGGAPWHWPLIEDILGRAGQLRAAAAALRVPVTLVRGAASHLNDAAVASFLSVVPSATVCVVEAAGHLVARDQPEALAEVLLGFVQQPALF
jgi:pimeloyl-ACP methyl ester carboxylesterase